MSSQKEQFRELERLARFRVLRNWAVGLSLASFTVAFTALGFGGVANPKTWSSLYSALAREGWMHSLVVPFGAAGLALLIVGALLHGLASRRHGEF
jgi:hypothetical protein